MMDIPDPADWLHGRRTLDGWGHSPLDQINRDNVRLPQLVWAGVVQGHPVRYAVDGKGGARWGIDRS